MSADATTTSDGAHSHGTLTSYMIGFILSVILTAIPFYLVMTGVLHSNIETAIAIMALAVVQIFVHMIYFLHMNTKVRRRLVDPGADVHADPRRDRADRFALGHVSPQLQYDAYA